MWFNIQAQVSRSKNLKAAVGDEERKIQEIPFYFLRLCLGVQEKCKAGTEGQADLSFSQ